MDDDESFGASLGAVFGSTEWIVLDCWLGIKVDDPVGTSVGVVLGTTESLTLGCWLGREEGYSCGTSFWFGLVVGKTEWLILGF
jgi:hypothetical protein